MEEHTPPELWFVDGVEGPWEWKGPVIREHLRALLPWRPKAELKN